MRISTLERACRRTLLWVLLLVHAALWATIVLQDGSGLRLPAAAGQSALAMWLLIAGPGRWFYRAPLALVALAALWAAALDAQADLLAPILAIQAAVVGVVLATARFAGACCVRESDCVETGRGGRYSVRSLLALTSLAAICVFVAKAVRTQVETLAVVPSTVAIGSMEVALSAVSLLAIWAALAPRCCWLRLALVGALAPVCGAAAAYACGRNADIPVFAAAAAIQAALICGSLLIVRLAGFRFVNQRAAARLNPIRSAKRRSASRLNEQFAGELA